MADARFDVLTIGNAIIDVFAKVDDEFLQKEGMDKSIMHLVDAERSEYLYSRLPGNPQHISGGSCCNTAVGVSSLGGNGAFIGKVAEDDLGQIFRKDLTKAGVVYTTPTLIHGTSTARSMIVITPDGERTMNTYLGACQELTVADMDEDLISASALTFMEGYLWDPPEAKRAFVKAGQLAHKHQRLAGITLSDPFCVDRFRDEFINLLRNKTMDVLLANEDEIKSLYQVDNLSDAVKAVQEDCATVAITLGSKGALAIKDGTVSEVPAFKVEQVEDVTGAGDLFASGFLYGLARGQTMDQSLSLGCLCASEIISHVGARPNMSLEQMAKDTGLAL
ncbi:adenosine kinase [Maritalea sp.]|uniref:adenosine kinase n=1 Tax=Maritalea sp. TaxID=2003361 RepID=UPI003EFAFF46